MQCSTIRLSTSLYITGLLPVVLALMRNRNRNMSCASACALADSVVVVGPMSRLNDSPARDNETNPSSQPAV